MSPNSARSGTLRGPPPGPSKGFARRSKCTWRRLRSTWVRADVSTAPNAALTGELERLQSEAEKLAKEYRRDRQALETLLAETAGLPPADLTLEKAIEQRAKDVANAYLAQLAAARAAAEEEAQRTLREAEQAATQAKADADAERMRKEAEEHVKTQQQQAEIFKREEEARRLRALAEDPQIQKEVFRFSRDRDTCKFGTSPGGRPLLRRIAPSASVIRRPRPPRLAGKRPEIRVGHVSAARQDYHVSYNDRPTHPSPRTAGRMGRDGTTLRTVQDPSDRCGSKWACSNREPNPANLALATAARQP